MREGDEVVLTCTILQDKCNDTVQCLASHIVFRHAEIEYRSPPFVRVLNATTAQFVMPNITIDMHGHYFCLIYDSNTSGPYGFRASTSVNIARKS